MSYNRPWWPSGQSHHVSKFQIQVETEAKVPGLNPRSGLCVLPLLLLWLTRWVRVFPFSSALAYVTRFFVDLNWKPFLGAAKSEPSTFQSNAWQIRPQDHGVLHGAKHFIFQAQYKSMFAYICFVNSKYFLCFNTFLFCSLNDLLRGR